MIYLFASGKDVIMGMVFRMKPVRAVAGLASTVFIMQSATNHFAKQIAWKYDATFFISLLSFAIVMRLFVEIPYARWSLSFFESKFGQKSSTSASTEKRHDQSCAVHMPLTTEAPCTSRPTVDPACLARCNTNNADLKWWKVVEKVPPRCADECGSHRVNNNSMVFKK